MVTSIKPGQLVAGAATMYYFGATATFASRADPRIPYCLYVPEDHPVDDETAIIVAIHGTDRNFIGYRDYFKEFGRWKNCIVIAPLFAAGIMGDDNRDGYKHLAEGDLRYDEILLAIVDEVAERYGVGDRRFALWGFSGGGQFANRFLLRHPRRLWAAAIGAPGSVTMIDDERDWWVGTRDFEARFGHPLDREALKQVPVQMVVGKADLETWEITHKPGSKHWIDGANDAGATRPERSASLKRSFEAAGMGVEMEVVPNMAHESSTAASRAAGFLARKLDDRRAGTPR